MNLSTLCHHLAHKVGAVDDYPFDPQTLVFKVRGKMFALVARDEEPLRVTLKCDAQEAEALRAAFPAVRPGRYMHKAHWNTVTLDGTVPEDLLREMMDNSYSLVVQALTRAERAAPDQTGL